MRDEKERERKYFNKARQKLNTEWYASRRLTTRSASRERMAL